MNLYPLKKSIADLVWQIRHYRSERIFCIGMIKTGTTSLAKALYDLGFRVGNQRRGELLLDSYARRDFRPLVTYCRTAEAFQDIPFGLPFTHVILDHCFPRSKFILSVRDDEDQWYRSLVRFHSQKFGNGRVPSVEDLRKADYCEKGWMWKVHSLLFDLTDYGDPYDESTLKLRYRIHNRAVIEYFRGRSEFLFINVAERNAYQKLCSFLGREPKHEPFPWVNRTEG